MLRTFHNNFLLFLFAKLGRHVVPPNYKIEKMLSIIGYFALQWWDQYEAKKKLIGFHQFMYYLIPCNFIKFWTFLTNNLIIAKPEKRCYNNNKEKKKHWDSLVQKRVQGLGFNKKASSISNMPMTPPLQQTYKKSSYIFYFSNHWSSPTQCFFFFFKYFFVKQPKWQLSKGEKEKEKKKNPILLHQI